MTAIDDDLNIALVVFYNKLLDAQEPLGEEFQKVLDDNRWDLYARSDK